MDEQTYKAALLHAYEAEIVNEAWFLAMADRMPGARQKRCLDLLAEVERHAAAALLPVLQRYALVPAPREELLARGRAEVRACRPDGWDGLLRHLVDAYPQYVREFEALEQVAPAADRDALRRLTRHEVVTIEFARRELAGDADSQVPLGRYLGRYLGRR
jgi:dimethylamine/trimethylamine dehydrogenase